MGRESNSQNWKFTGIDLCRDGEASKKQRGEKQILQVEESCAHRTVQESPRHG